ncbi:OsmC family protein [Burkholderia cenocepacia]|uniref:OsmC family protein n=1 Tax=Burkholderia cenocepacia TaxID=95486 RepID=UPI002938EB1B|nr:OsmC family protein [Burkholderia cenocepacia]
MRRKVVECLPAIVAAATWHECEGARKNARGTAEPVTAGTGTGDCLPPHAPPAYAVVTFILQRSIPMVTATRLGKPYCVEIGNGRSVVRSDTRKAGKGGDAGLRPHELLESALAACVCMSVELAAERAGVTLPACTVDVTLERRDVETGFDIALRFVVPLSQAQHILVRDAVRASPVARTLGKPIRIGPATIAHD